MRIIISLLVALLPISNIHSQSLELDASTNMYVMKGVIQCDSSLSRKALYERSKEWVVRNLKSSDNNINLDDKDFKQMTATGNIKGKNQDFPLSFINATINFKLTIDVKDGKIRYTIENIVYYATMTDISHTNADKPVNMPIEQVKRKNKFQERIFDDVEQKLVAMVNNLTISIKQDVKKEDNW